MKPLLVGIALLTVAQVCLAQSSVRALPPTENAAGTPSPSGPDPNKGEALAPDDQPPPARVWPVLAQPGVGPAFWADADYLMWWMRHGPLSAPLLTTGDPTNAVPGALGQPGTRVLFGGSGLDYGTFSGGRLMVGGWLDSDQAIGIEGGGFLFEQKAIRFAVASDNTGVPPIYLPVINQDPASANFRGQGSFTVADPLFPSVIGPTSGNVAVSSATRLWGAELNGLFNLARAPSWRLDGIVGFRYLDLQESLAARRFFQRPV